ncbi:MAG: phospho-N-acetylmuramoyl-pentapeptide-transferase [Lachnospiraceae bacterium]|nr:phospho-N-acetylmuramoyl-pentapeptide-transferase [Lachnospiraceae bacterium]
MTTSGFIAFIVAFAITLCCGPFAIPFLLRLKIGQTVRDDGPKSHLKKNGTPTMGGLMFLPPVLIASLIILKGHSEIISVLILTYGCALIGFIDDYIKVVLKRAMGLKAWQKMSMQFILTIFYVCYIKYINPIDLSIVIPFTHNSSVDIGIFTVPLIFFAVLGTVNGSNFTDGLDGLATKVTLVICGFFAVIAVTEGSNVEPVIFAFIGGLLAFLVYNVHPAKVFMGDTGSLALGGFVVSVAYTLRMPLFIIIVAFIYFAEVLSVILQVGYFKLTHGKRIFKMAPIHHHFELCGWEETRVVEIFTIVTVVLCVIGYIAYI